MVILLIILSIIYIVAISVVVSYLRKYRINTPYENAKTIGSTRAIIGKIKSNSDLEASRKRVNNRGTKF